MSPISRRSMLAASAALLGVGEMVLQADPAQALISRPIQYTAWSRAGRFALGKRSHLAIDSRGGLVLTGTPSRGSYTDPYGPRRSYEYGGWSSPWVHPAFGLTELIASWNAATPTGTWVEISLHGKTATGATTPWYRLGRWCSGDAPTDIHRVSVPGQSDGYGEVDTDTFRTRGGHELVAYQLGVRLFRPAGSSGGPRVSLMAAVASALPPAKTVHTSPVGVAAGKVLAVPTYSQELHKGHYPQWDGGGEAWCSATSTAMVLDYLKLGPPPAVTKWVTIPGETRPQVDHVARCVYDYAYRGTGNWPFNTAYAAARGAHAFVTRFHSLNEAEHLVAAGIPLICSVSFTAAELTGAGYGTKGHLLVIVGFTKSGDVVVNDPASHLKASDKQVRVTYRRSQFENAWLPAARSGGAAYVMTPAGMSLPRVPYAHEPTWD